MKIRPYTDFYARLLGGFSLYHREREIGIGTSLQNKSMQMLLMILQARAEGVERSKLLALIRPGGKDGDGSVGKRANNLRQHLYILRKLLARSGLPEGDYIILEGDRCYFSKVYPVDTDVGYLDQLIGELSREGISTEEKEALYRRYCDAYTGEFLPMLGGEEWVAIESAYYQKWYGICLRNTVERLREENDYETMLALCTMASQYHPYDEWQAVQIECLMVMDRYREAMEIYETATENYYKELGTTSLDRVVERYREKKGRIRCGADTLEKVKMGLEEEETDSPYPCSYPSFLDIYRIVARFGERMGTKSLLMLCTLLTGGQQETGEDSSPAEPGRSPLIDMRQGGGDQATGTRQDGKDRMKGTWQDKEEHAIGTRQDGKDRAVGMRQDGGDRAIDTGRASGKQVEELEAKRRRYIEKRMIQLKQVLADSLRSGDVYTRYSENQYLVLLIKAGAEDGEQIVARLARYWDRTEKSGRAKVKFTIQEVEGPGAEGSEDGEERDIHCAYP